MTLSLAMTNHFFTIGIGLSILGREPYRVMEGKGGPTSNRMQIEALKMIYERTIRDIKEIATTLATMRRES